MEQSTVGETWGDDAEMDDELKLNIKVKRQSTAGSDKPHEERHNDAESDRPYTTATPEKTMRELHPQMLPKHATTNATPTVGITKLITLPKMADRSSIKGRQKQHHTRSPPWSTIYG